MMFDIRIIKIITLIEAVIIFDSAFLTESFI